jgi:hypothetical protein
VRKKSRNARFGPDGRQSLSRRVTSVPVNEVTEQVAVSSARLVVDESSEVDVDGESVAGKSTGL